MSSAVSGAILTILYATQEGFEQMDSPEHEETPEEG
jgi:hypothetical protein